MRRMLIPSAIATATVALVMALGQFSPALADDHKENGSSSASDAKVVVGTFDAQAALKPYREHFRAKQQKIRQQMRKDMQKQMQQQGGGNNQDGQRRQKMMQARRKAQQKAQKKMQKVGEEVRGRMDKDMNKVLPDVAEKAGVDLIVPQVSYKADHVKVKDLSKQVTKAMGEVAPETKKPEKPSMPGMPGRGQGQGKGQGQDKGQGQGKGKGQGGNN